MNIKVYRFSFLIIFFLSSFMSAQTPVKPKPKPKQKPSMNVTTKPSVKPTPQKPVQKAAQPVIKPVVPAAPVAPPKKEESLEISLLKKNIQISNWLDQLAEKIDLALVGKRVSKSKNETNLKIQNSTFSTEGKQVVNSFSISLNPRFPNLEEYFQLKFTSTDDRTENRQAVSNSLSERQKEKNYNASVGLVNNLGKVKTSFQPTVQFKDKVTLSHSLNFDLLLENKKSAINPKLELFANADKGVGFYNAVNFHYQLSPVFGFTFINEAEYIERLNQYTVNNGPALSQFVNDKVTLGYSLIFTSINRPSYHLEGANLAFSYSRHIYKKILDVQIVPQLDFQKTRRFKGAAGLTFNINLKF